MCRPQFVVFYFIFRDTLLLEMITRIKDPEIISNWKTFRSQNIFDCIMGSAQIDLIFYFYGKTLPLYNSELTFGHDNLKMVAL